MKKILSVLLMSAAMNFLCRGDETTTLAASGQITALGAAKPHTITADVKSPDGTKSETFLVSESCKFMTSGIGVFDDLKKGDNVQIEYSKNDGGQLEASQITVQNLTPPPTSPPKKAPAKKSKKKK